MKRQYSDSRLRSLVLAPPRCEVSPGTARKLRLILSLAAVFWLQLGIADLRAAENEVKSPAGLGTVPAVTSVGTTSPSAPPLEPADDKQTLAVGDSVVFRVVEDQELARVLTITDAGQLDVPELGLVPAVGKTCKQLSDEIKAKLEESTYYRATVIMGVHLLNKTMSGRRVHVAGYVLRQGPQDMPPGESWTVSKAILNAGGFTEFADGKNVKLVRTGPKGTPSKTMVINILDVLKKGRSENDVPVEPEDVIYVPIRKW